MELVVEVYQKVGGFSLVVHGPSDHVTYTVSWRQKDSKDLLERTAHSPEDALRLVLEHASKGS